MPDAHQINDYLLDIQFDAFERLGAFLNNTPDAISADLVRQMQDEIGCDAKYSYTLLLAAYCGLDISANAMHKDMPPRMENGEKPDQEAMKARHEQMKAQREATDAKIEALLTPEQAAKFAEMKNERGEAPHGRHHKGPRGGDKMAPGHDGCCGNCCCKDNK